MMAKQKAKQDISPCDYTSPVMDMLYATASEAKQIPSEIEPLVPNQEMLNDVLQEISAVLSQALDLSKKEIILVKSGKRTNGGSLPNDYAISLASNLLRLENLLYIYADTSKFDAYAIWSYIKDFSRTNCDNVDVQFSENKVVFRVPYLPRRNYGNNAVVNHMLAAKICELKTLPVWEKWSATFFHVYPVKTKDIPRDVDNYDYKKTIDLLAFAFGSADNALNFDIGGKHTIFTDKLAPGVYIEVTPKSSENAKFPAWKNTRGRPPKTAETAEKAD